MFKSSLPSLLFVSLLVPGCGGDAGSDSDSQADASSAGDAADETTGDSGGDGDADAESTGDGDGDGEPSYPAEPWGVEVGDTFGKYIWYYGDGSEFHTETLFNVPQRAIVMYATASWCGSCRTEVEMLTPMFAAASDDILPVGVIFENDVGQAPTPAVAEGYNAPGTTFEFVADVNRDFDSIFPDGVSIPRLLVIDSRDMSIYWKYEGHDSAAFVAAITDLLNEP